MRVCGSLLYYAVLYVGTWRNRLFEETGVRPGRLPYLATPHTVLFYSCRLEIS